MKNKMLSIISLIFIVGFGGLRNSKAQAVVKGHITAEVIESVSASSQALTSLYSVSPTANIIQTQEVSSQNSLTIKFAGKTINPGDIVTVNVADNSVSFSLAEGNAISSVQSIENRLYFDSESANSPLNKISDPTNLSTGLASGTVNGLYTVVFACN